VDLLAKDFLGDWDEREERGEFEVFVRLSFKESNSSDSGVRAGFFFGGGGGGGRADIDFGGAGGGDRSRVGSLAFGGGGGTPPKN